MRRAKPIYQQIANKLRRRIIAGRYEISGVPPELKLVEEFGVSRHTIRSSLQSLVQDGLIERRAGLGTRVSKRAKGEAWAVESIEDLIGEFSIEQSVTLSAGVVPARQFPRVAGLFNVRKDAKLFHVVRLLTAEDKIFAMSHAFTTVSLASRLPAEEVSTTPIIELVERYCGEHALGARQIASVGSADKETARQLSIEVREPILVLHRSYYNSEDKLIVHAEMLCRPDRYQQVVDFVRDKGSLPTG